MGTVWTWVKLGCDTVRHDVIAKQWLRIIASEASNPSLKRKSPKQTRTNSVFAKIGLTEELRHSKCISCRKIPRIHYISILPAKLINIPKNLVVMSWKWCSNVMLTVTPLANATDTVTLSWQWLDTFVALSRVKSMAGIMIIDKIDYSRVKKLGGKHLQHVTLPRWQCM